MAGFLTSLILWFEYRLLVHGPIRLKAIVNDLTIALLLLASNFNISDVLLDKAIGYETYQHSAFKKLNTPYYFQGCHITIVYRI